MRYSIHGDFFDAAGVLEKDAAELCAKGGTKYRIIYVFNTSDDGVFAAVPESDLVEIDVSDKGCTYGTLRYVDAAGEVNPAKKNRKAFTVSRADEKGLVRVWAASLDQESVIKGDQPSLLKGPAQKAMAEETCSPAEV